MAEKPDDDDLPGPPSSAFDAPRPPATSAAETAALVGAVGAFVALDVLTCGLLGAVVSIPDVAHDEHARPIDVRALERQIPGLAQTSPPHLTPDHDARCTACGTAVPFASMSLDEHGYFCRRCAAVR